MPFSLLPVQSQTLSTPLPGSGRGLAIGGPVAAGQTTAGQAAAVGQAALPSSKLSKAAHDFEAAMMKELLAPLEAGHDALLGGDEEEQGGSIGALGSYASEALGRAISEHGGFGIATRILHQLQGSKGSASRVPGSDRSASTVSGIESGNQFGKPLVSNIRNGNSQHSRDK